MEKKAFTLIELIAVLVILAILALIVTPLVMNIIRKARISADKRSIDAYGRSVELAIANYLLDNGDFPTDVSQLTIEYTGDEVVCSTTQLNSDSSVYLAGCTVAGRNVENYTYGKEKSITYDYRIGDEISYNGVDYYVIKDSSTSEPSVTLLKAEPITSDEITAFLISTEIAGKVNTRNKYIAMPYYTSEDCLSAGDISNCSTDYEVSNVKQVIDIWANNYILENDLSNDYTGYDARLLTIEELKNNLGYEWNQICPTCDDGWVQSENTPIWVSDYLYWTMSSVENENSSVYIVNGSFAKRYYVNSGVNVRPVITLKKSALN